MSLWVVRVREEHSDETQDHEFHSLARVMEFFDRELLKDWDRYQNTGLAFRHYSIIPQAHLTS